ncbi:MAG: hypothetical protein ACUVWA_13805 [Candidatus Oleimicrobiaceae bacterium]
MVSPYVVKPFPWGLVGVTAYLDPNILSLVDAAKVTGGDLASLEEVVSVLDSLARMVDITVLLAHAPIEKCRELAHTFRAADVIVAAHDQKVQTIPLTSDGVRIVEAGRYGGYLGCLEVRVERGRVAEAVDLSIPVVPR